MAMEDVGGSGFLSELKKKKKEKSGAKDKKVIVTEKKDGFLKKIKGNKFKIGQK